MYEIQLQPALIELIYMALLLLLVQRILLEHFSFLHGILPKDSLVESTLIKEAYFMLYLAFGDEI